MFDIEIFLNFDAGFNSDIKFYDRWNRKILVREIVFENQIEVLKKADRKYIIEKCIEKNINFDIYISDENFRTTETQKAVRFSENRFYNIFDDQFEQIYFNIILQKKS
jgi:phage FluMu protein Com